MPKFLTRQEIYRVLQRELPEGVFPDGAPSGFYSTADMDSVSDVVATGYGTLERVYDNYFPQTADEFIGDWLDKLFVGISFDPLTTLQEKRDRVIAKIRKQPTIRLWEVLILAASYVPPGTYVQIIEYNCADNGGFWELGVSELGVTTTLGFNNSFHQLGISPNDFCEFVSTYADWELGVSELGVSTVLNQYNQQQVLEPQITAYGYELRIFEYEVTGTTLQQMIRNLNETEPARSLRVLVQNLNLSDFGLNTIVPEVGEFDLINCITIDPLSSTGYSGRVT